MDVFILDSLLRRETVLDRFESMIWTERYSAWGDFQLVIHSTIESRSLLTSGTHLTIRDSTRVMVVETVINQDDSEGRHLLNVSGRSLEAILEDRIAHWRLLNSSDPWDNTGTPYTVANWIFTSVCVDGRLKAADKIPFYKTGSIYPPDTISKTDVPITHNSAFKTVYESIKEICEAAGLGFRLVRNGDKSELRFDIYSGIDRTSTQATSPTVIFSPDHENLTNVSELNSSEKYKNVAYVFAPNGYRTVFAVGAGDSTAGFERRILMVKADDITLPAGTPLQDALLQRGMDELAKNRTVSAIDGELPQTSKYKYGLGLDYNLGDLVEVRTDDGVTNRMRISEQIFVSDAEGDRSYPTLARDLFITPGSWYAWDSGQAWDDAVGTWDEV